MLKEHHGGDHRKVERAGDLEDGVLGKTVLWRGHGCSSCGYFSKPKIKLGKNLNRKWEGAYKPRPCPTEMPRAAGSYWGRESHLGGATGRLIMSQRWPHTRVDICNINWTQWSLKFVKVTLTQWGRCVGVEALGIGGKERSRYDQDTLYTCMKCSKNTVFKIHVVK